MLRFPQFPSGVWIRTCQECGYKQLAKMPNDHDKTENWRELKCKKCKSIAMDYGMINDEIEDEE